MRFYVTSLISIKTINKKKIVMNYL